MTAKTLSDVENRADEFLTALLKRGLERRDDFVEFVKEMEEVGDRKRLEIDPNLTLAPKKLRRVAQEPDEQTYYGMAIDTTLGSIGRARDWVNSTEGHSSPYGTDKGFLILSESEQYGRRGQWISPGDVLVYSKYGEFDTYLPHLYELDPSEGIESLKEEPTSV